MNWPIELFVDTSFLIALANSSDVNHQQALTLQLQLSQQKVHRITSEYVLFELGDGLSRLRFRAIAEKMIALIRRDKLFEIVPASTPLLEHSLHLFRQRPDKERGLTDCSSFIIMQQRDIQVALTADHHFEQAGFLSLLRTHTS